MLPVRAARWRWCCSEPIPFDNSGDWGNQRTTTFGNFTASPENWHDERKMRGLLNRQKIVPAAFYAAGLFILNWHRLAFGNSLPARVNSLDPISRVVFELTLTFGALIAFATAWGLGNHRKWPRWTGIFPCLLVAMVGFPWFSVAGVVGIWLLWSHPAAKTGFAGATEFWSPRRASGWQMVASILCWTLLTTVFYSKYLAYAAQPFQSEWAYFHIPILLLTLWINIVIHESAHALASQAVGFRLRTFAVGPFVIARKGNAFQLRFSTQSLSLASGYIYSLPVNQHRFREKQIIVIAAGPVANLLAGAALFGVTGLLAHSAAAFLWLCAAEGCVTALATGLTSLLPIGYSDGTMLYHLLLRTQHGKEFENLQLRAAGLIAIEDNLAERREALRQLLESRAPDPVKVGVQYVLLGQAEVGAQHIRDAESHLVEGLAKIPDDVEPSVRLGGWQALHSIRCVRRDRPGSDEAYRRALAIALSIREQYKQPLARIGTFAAVASLHSRAHAWKETLEETAAGLLFYAGHGGGEERQWGSSHGRLLRLRAHALLQTGSIDAGLHAVEEAVAAIRTQPAGTTGPWELAVLADTLWDAGQLERAIPLLAEAVGLLEERGGARLAARFRLLLAEFMAHAGHVGQAACVLPSEPEDPELRRKYFEARAVVRRAAGSLSESAADLSAALACCERGDPVDETELAVTRAKLASVLAEAGEIDRAESLAKDALEKLSAVGHPDLAGAFITLAAVAGRRGGPAADHVARAIHCWQVDEWRFPAAKAREAEAAARLLDSAGVTALAAQCRALIPHLWPGPGVVRVSEDLALAGSAA